MKDLRNEVIKECVKMRAIGEVCNLETMCNNKLIGMKIKEIKSILKGLPIHFNKNDSKEDLLYRFYNSTGRVLYAEELIVRRKDDESDKEFYTRMYQYMVNTAL